MNITCAELTCPSEAPVCNLATHPSFNNCTVASCITEDQVQEHTSSRLGSRDTCQHCLMEGFTCVDLCQGDGISVGKDCTTFNCKEAYPCTRGYTCMDISGTTVGQKLESNSLCIPSHLDISIDANCTSEQAPCCNPGQTCTEYKIGDYVVGSFCDHGTIPNLPCSGRTCPEDNEVCTENSFESVALHSLCRNTRGILHQFAVLGQDTCSILS